MTQPIDIISRALKDIGALEAGETPTPEAAQDAAKYAAADARQSFLLYNFFKNKILM